MITFPKKTSLLHIAFVFALLAFQQLGIQAQAQDSTFSADQNAVTISLLTCAPGAELYSIFGHSAIRVQDSSKGIDDVYNYGMFSFRTPNFYVKFVRGKLPYWVSKGKFDRFMREYEHEQRDVVQNEFLLSSEEKTAVLDFLNNNIKKENRVYAYDFFYDNCSSRIRDVLEVTLGDRLRWNPKEEKEYTYRNLLDLYLIDSHWADYGIDLILGMPTDERADIRQQMFLPDFLRLNFERGEVNRKGSWMPLVGPTRTLITFPKVRSTTPLYKRPLGVLLMLLVLVAGLSFWKPRAKAWVIFDWLWIFALGAAGALFLGMWTVTDHQACYANWNMLWAFPLNIIMAFLMFWKKDWVIKYFKFIFILSLVALLGWFFWPQEFHLAFLPMMLITLIRLYARFFALAPDKHSSRRA